MKTAVIIFLYILTSCRKPNNGTLQNGEITGTVYNIETNEPVPVAIVFLMKGGGGSFNVLSGGGGFSFPIAETRTDSNGNFIFYDRDDEDYYVSAEKDLYKPSEFDVEDVQNNKADIYLQPLGFIQLHIKNTEPYDDYYKFVFDYYTYVTWGPDVDTIVCCLTLYGNQNNTLRWSLYGDSVISISKEVYCPQFDTTLYEIFY